MQEMACRSQKALLGSAGAAQMPVHTCNVLAVLRRAATPQWKRQRLVKISCAEAVLCPVRCLSCGNDPQMSVFQFLLSSMSSCDRL